MMYGIMLDGDSTDSAPECTSDCGELPERFPCQWMEEVTRFGCLDDCGNSDIDFIAENFWEPLGCGDADDLDELLEQREDIADAVEEALEDVPEEEQAAAELLVAAMAADAEVIVTVLETAISVDSDAFDTVEERDAAVCDSVCGGILAGTGADPVVGVACSCSVEESRRRSLLADDDLVATATLMAIEGAVFADEDAMYEAMRNSSPATP